MYIKALQILLIASAFVATALTSAAQLTVNYEAELILNTSSGKLAPYYIASNRHGILTQKSDALLRLGAWKPIDTGKRFSYSYGLEFITGYSKPAAYSHYNAETATMGIRRNGPAPIWIQQLYGEVKYRSLYLNAGAKQRESYIVDFNLSSGDVIESGNARPIPQIRAGFIDFQNIPLTNGWLQIQGEIAYGKFVQNQYLRNHFNYYSGQLYLSSGHINLGTLYHYKHCYFRTKPSEPFSAIFGAQFACQFGGETYYFYNGELLQILKNRKNIKAFWQALIPFKNNNEGFYYEGQHLGSWDIALRYRFDNGAKVKAYVMNLWEDGSGMGKLNGFDGLWGLEYKASEKKWIDGVVIEYIDFTNQSGPIHWDEVDIPGTTITGVPATGADNYYNNAFYNAYANFGMSIGTPFNKAPIYNLNGDVDFIDTRVRGFHIGINGSPSNDWNYRILCSYRKSWGTYQSPRLNIAHDTSAMAEVTYRPTRISGLAIKGQIAADRGALYGNNFGGCVTITYSGLFNLIKK